MRDLVGVLLVDQFVDLRHEACPCISTRSRRADRPLGERHSETFRRYAEAVRHVARHAHGGPTFHDLRHSYETWLVDDGVPVNMVQRVMGHERASTTLDIYTRRTSDVDRILEALSDDDDDDPPTVLSTV
jgi:integrase